MKSGESFKRSPFFYVGDKFKIIGKIKNYFPKEINNFYEPFLGGGSVFLNVEAKKYYLNDIDKNIISLHKFLIEQSKQENKFLDSVKKVIEKYDLSRSVFKDVIPKSLKTKWVKTYYAEYNRTGYNLLRKDFNNSVKKDPLKLYLLLIFGFNRMLRFNKKGEFNIPVGNVDFNRNVLNALHEYFLSVKNKKIHLYSKDFKDFINKNKFKKNDFVYVDPPYLISSSEYNKLWDKNNEKDLLNTLDKLSTKGVKFALSNVTHYRSKRNEQLITWMKKYKVYPIDSNYISYHNNKKKDIKEVLITNY